MQNIQRRCCSAPRAYLGHHESLPVCALLPNLGPPNAGVFGFGHGGGLVTPPGKCSARVKQARHEWQKRRIPFMRRQPERLVFIDETSVKTNLTRLRGRARRGQRLRMDAPFGGWGTQTFIAGLTSEGLIAPWVIKGEMDGSAFATYVRDVLAPELTPGTVVILDNLATHRNVEATDAIRDAKCWFLYLPPYSPDLNPIEQAFSKLKAHLRKIGARTFNDLFRALGDICSMFSPQECWNYFHAAGYLSG